MCVCGIEGNIDQVQYCDKIKNIVDFLGTRLSDEELMKIWKMQVCDTRPLLKSDICMLMTGSDVAYVGMRVIGLNKNYVQDRVSVR